MLLHEDKTKKIFQTFYTIYNELGYGFREEVYENSLPLDPHPINLSLLCMLKLS